MALFPYVSEISKTINDINMKLNDLPHDLLWEILEQSFS